MPLPLSDRLLLECPRPDITLPILKPSTRTPRPFVRMTPTLCTSRVYFIVTLPLTAVRHTDAADKHTPFSAWHAFCFAHFSEVLMGPARSIRFLLIAIPFIAAPACDDEKVQTGRQDNFSAICQTTEDCDAQFDCICGICTTLNCLGVGCSLDSSTCVPPNADGFHPRCVNEVMPVDSICVASCNSTADCPDGLRCTMSICGGASP
jgi:hypothetical protein